MVLDPVTAFAVAGNVLQFLQLGSQFAVRATAICLARSSGLTQLRELRQLTVELQMSLQQLEKHSKGTSVASEVSITASEARLASLSTDCSKLAKELVMTLDKIGVTDKGGRMDTILTGFRAYFNTSLIDELTTRIDVHRNQLATTLVVSMRFVAIHSNAICTLSLKRLSICLRHHITLSLIKQEMILHELTEMRKSMKGATTSFAEAREQGAEGYPGHIIMDYLSGFLKPGTEHQAIDKLHEAISYIISNPVKDYKDWDNVIGKEYPDFRLSQSKESSLRDQLIQDLRFREMDYRESVISKAYRDTFEWILQDSDPMKTGFVAWLQSDSNLYWISGKAGSGKSTLMKFIDTHELDPDDQTSRCRRYLERWAEGRSLVVASFYFWASGTSIEASQQGLLQALLYQLLKQRPDIIPMVVPQIWESACLFGSSKMDRTENKLRRMLNSAVKTLTTSCSSRVCLFIDGLNEFDGDPHQLLTQFKQLTELPNVKLCLASRPWIVFEDAFSQKPSLMLQNLTHPDLKHFVASEFSNNEGFRRLQIRDPKYASELMDEITDKSSGVFLWVKLVVKSLLAGLTFDDRISDLQRRLDALPVDLENLYVAILENLDPFYHEHASQYFKLMMAARDPPSALVFSFADEEDPEFVLKQSVMPLTDDEVSMRVTTTRRRLNSRCKGLLELGPENRVQFLHRSVKDYLDSLDIQRRLEEATGDFDAHLKYCAAYLSALKSTISERPDFDAVAPQVKLCLFAAAGASKNKPLVLQFLDALNQVLLDRLSPSDIKAVYQMVPNIKGLSAWSQQSFGISFLALTVRFCVIPYVAARVPTGCMAQQFDANSTKRPQTGKGRWYSSPSPPPRPQQYLKLFRNSSPRKSNRLSKLRRIISWRGSGSSKRSRSGAVTWSLLLDANFGHPPKAEMFKCLFEHDADCNVVYDRDEGGVDTPWTNVLAAAFAAALYPETRDEWFGWMPTVRLFVENGAKVSRRTVHQVVARMQRIRMNMLDGEQAYGALRSVLDGDEELALRQLRGEATV